MATKRSSAAAEPRPSRRQRQENFDDKQQVRDDEMQEFCALIDRCKQVHNHLTGVRRTDPAVEKSSKKTDSDEEVDEFYNILSRIKKARGNIRSANKKNGEEKEKKVERREERRWRPEFKKEDFEEEKFFEKIGDDRREKGALFDLNDVPVGAAESIAVAKDRC